jgi:TonB family protein
VGAAHLDFFQQDKSFVCTVKIQIKRDGTIASAEIIRSSGNPLMDQSCARRLESSNPPSMQFHRASEPAIFHSVNIDFELQ